MHRSANSACAFDAGSLAAGAALEDNTPASTNISGAGAFIAWMVAITVLSSQPAATSAGLLERGRPRPQQFTTGDALEIFGRAAPLQSRSGFDEDCCRRGRPRSVSWVLSPTASGSPSGTRFGLARSYPERRDTKYSVV